MPNRSVAERAAHARGRLANDPNVWIATASSTAMPHLVPLSLAWLDDQLVVATPSDTATARNAATSGRARASLDNADDVVIMDCRVEVIPLGAAAPSLLDRYAARVGWDPRQESGDWVILVLTIWRAHAWNSPSEIDGRTFVRDGTWLG